MRVLCRADASVELGTGHIVRCANLAQRLAEAGHQVEFACCALPGHLNRWLETHGFRVHTLAADAARPLAQLTDAAACRAAIGERDVDWLVVDHYALGVEWEQAMAAVVRQIFVIDDLGRRHECDLLLDQNYADPVHALYRTQAPASCELLFGPQFALVGAEFAALRAASLRRDRGRLSRLLVFMSGSDPANETSKVVAGIALADRPELVVDVVIGASNPHRTAVEAACAGLANVSLHVQTARMAELMAAADCAIGAVGSATWERCTLGLPALVAILADNQAPTAQAVATAGAHRLLGRHNELQAEDYADALLSVDAASLHGMSTAAAAICDGGGAERVAARLIAAGDERDRHSARPHA